MLTLAQLYNLGKNVDIDIFDGLLLPDDSPLNREILINTIMEKNGLNIPMYADVNVMRSAINIWSARNQYTFIHIGKIYSAEYSPIENTDKYDSISVSRSRDMTDNTTNQSAKTEDLDTTSGTMTSNTNAHTGKDTTDIEEKVSAFNASDYVPDTTTKNETTYASTITDTGSSNTIGTSDKTTNLSGSNNKTIDEDETTTTTQHLHGNIGVTTNTQLQTEEYQLMADYNPYVFISGLFENELTLCIY